MTKRILILHATAGAGHKRAAEALAAAAKIQAPDTEIVVRDILDFTAPIFKKTYAEGYLNLVRTIPELWGYLYTRIDKNATKPYEVEIRKVFNKLNTLTFTKFFKELQPDAVICTHFMPLEILSSAIAEGKTSVPLYCVVTDFAVHSMWVMKNVESYYVANEESKRYMVRHGQAEDRVKCTGIPIDPIFSQSLASEKAKARLGLDRNLPAVLILGGGFGVGPTAQLLGSFQHVGSLCQVLVVAGKNEEMQRNAEAIGKTLGCPVKVFGFVNNIHELMDASDLIISKPGGLTSCEVLAKHKPLAIIDPIPGQEQRNCEYLLEIGAAVRLYDIDDAPYKIQELLNDKERLQQMAANAEKAAKSRAAFDIIQDVIAGLKTKQ
jgi:processive 1,2-diacylglycerol beta-glucosyltransferase